MACILYKDSEKILVDPIALDNMLAQGWKTKPDYPETPPTAAEFVEFLNLHEELKRVSDEAMSARDAQIKELTEQNEQLTEDLEVLEAENIHLREMLVQVLQELEGFKKQADGEPTDPDLNSLTVPQLQELAKRANIKNVKKFRKDELIKALENGSESEN